MWRDDGVFGGDSLVAEAVEFAKSLDQNAAAAASDRVATQGRSSIRSLINDLFGYFTVNW